MEKRLIIICCPPYSYSSLLSGYFHKLGYDTGTHNSEYRNYPKYEDQQLQNFIDKTLFQDKITKIDFSVYDFSKPVILKYPHACLILDKIEIFAKPKIKLDVIFPFRNPISIFKSLKKRKQNPVPQFKEHWPKPSNIYNLFMEKIINYPGNVYTVNMERFIRYNNYEIKNLNNFVSPEINDNPEKVSDALTIIKPELIW